MLTVDGNNVDEFFGCDDINTLIVINQCFFFGMMICCPLWALRILLYICANCSFFCKLRILAICDLLQSAIFCNKIIFAEIGETFLLHLLQT